MPSKLDVMIAAMIAANDENDTELRHQMLDELLLDYINEPDIRFEFHRKKKWYV